MPSIPLKAQVAIRDNWNKEDSSFQKTVKALHELLGLEVLVQPEWQLLLAELGDLYPDKGNFVTSVAGLVQTWCKAMTELLDDEANEEWTEKLLDMLKSSWSRLRIFLEVAKGETTSTTWSETQGGFIIHLPKKQVTYPAEFFPLFKGEIFAAFEEPEKKALPRRPADGAGDDWAAVNVDASGRAGVVEKPSAARRVVEFMPEASTMPRPDELFLRPPYHLFVYSRGRNEVEVQCSHSPTLVMMSDYLKKWCRSNHNDTRNPPSVDVKLHPCSFGLGMMYDRLTLYAENKYGIGHFVNPAIVLALVEGALGYEEVYRDGASWTYRRDTPFKSM